MRAKLGLFTAEEEDTSLAQDLLQRMQAFGADYTGTLRDLASDPLPDTPFFLDPAFGPWRERWQARLKRQGEPLEVSRSLMRTRNPAVIPRNHRVEEALDAAVRRGDLTLLSALLAALSRPFDDLPEHAGYRTPAPRNHEYKTYCGT